MIVALTLHSYFGSTIAFDPLLICQNVSKSFWCKCFCHLRKAIKPKQDIILSNSTFHNLSIHTEFVEVSLKTGCPPSCWNNIKIENIIKKSYLNCFMIWENEIFVYAQ